MIPIESLEGITIMGQSHLTTKVCGGMYVQRNLCRIFSKRAVNIFWATDVHGSYQCSKAENKVLCMIQILR